MKLKYIELSSSGNLSLPSSLLSNYNLTIQVSSSGDATIVGSLTAHYVMIQLSSSGDVSLQNPCYITLAKWKTISSGSFKTKGGQIHDGTFNCGSSGDIPFENGKINKLEANTNSSGSILLNNTEINELFATTFSSGDIKGFIVLNRLEANTCNKFYQNL